MLKEKHPAPHSESSIPNPQQPDDMHPLPVISEEVITGAIRSFPRGSAGGPDGIRPQHLVDLTSASAERGGKDLLRALAEFTKFILRGDLPESDKQVFFGATLISLRKKDGGVIGQLPSDKYCVVLWPNVLHPKLLIPREWILLHSSWGVESHYAAKQQPILLGFFSNAINPFAFET